MRSQGTRCPCRKTGCGYGTCGQVLHKYITAGLSAIKGEAVYTGPGGSVRPFGDSTIRPFKEAWGKTLCYAIPTMAVDRESCCRYQGSYFRVYWLHWVQGRFYLYTSTRCIDGLGLDICWDGVRGARR